MKKLFNVFLLVLVMVMMVLSLGSADERNYYDRKTVRPAWCPGMVNVSSNTGTWGFVLAVAANPDRIDGYVANLASHPVRFSGTHITTQTIVDNGGYISATNTSDDDDKFFFRNGGVVYTGPLYFAAPHNEVTLDLVVVEINKN